MKSPSSEQCIALLSSIMNITDVMLVYLDPDFNFVWVNQAYADTCHMHPEDMLGKNHFALYPHAENEAIFRKVRDTGQPVFYRDKAFEFPDQPERGVTYWDWSLMPDLAADNQVIGLVFSLRETTPYVRRQQSADENELRFRSLFENMIEGYAHLRIVYENGIPRDFVFRDINRRFSELTGLGDVVGKTASEVIPGIFDLSPELLEISARVASSGTVEKLESFVPALDRWYLTTFYSTEPGSCVVVFDDISERKRTEAALRESERYRYMLEQQKIVQASLDGFWAMDPDSGRIVDVNDTYCKMIGYSRGEILQMNVCDLDVIETPEQSRDHLNKILKDGYDRFETRHRHKKGHLIDLEVSVSHANINGGVNYAFLRDISQRKMSIEALQLAMQHSQDLAKKLAESNERANRAIQASRLALWEYDLMSGNVYLSESWTQLLGGEPSPMVTTIDELTEQVPPEDRSAVKNAIVAALKGKDSSTYRIEHRVRKFSGESIWVLSEGAVIDRDRDGKALRMSGTNRDITERKKLEKELLEQRNEMDALQKSQVAAQTAAAFAHELNQPLLAIASYSDAALMLLNSKEPDFAKIRQAVEGSERQAQRAGKSIRELMDLLRLQEFPTEAFDLNKEILDIVDTARSELELLFHSTLQLEDDLPPVLANRTHVRKTLFNLLHNSVEAMQQAEFPAPQISISVRTKHDEDIAMITIQDNGPGFRRKDFQYLFTPFYTTKPRGFGMGLSISRSLIEANGGQLWVNPEEGPGATFHLTLPFAS